MISNIVYVMELAILAGYPTRISCVQLEYIHPKSRNSNHEGRFSYDVLVRGMWKSVTWQRTVLLPLLFPAVLLLLLPRKKTATERPSPVSRPSSKSWPRAAPCTPPPHQPRPPNPTARRRRTRVRGWSTGRGRGRAGGPELPPESLSERGRLPPLSASSRLTRV